MKDSLDRVLSTVLTLAAISIAVVLVHREFWPAGARNAEGVRAPSRTRVKDWSEILEAGRLVGDSAAKVKVVEFSDFECPFCKRADSTYHLAKGKYGKAVALVYVHFPLSIHRFAIPAARAAECANDQSRFETMHDLLFMKQDSLGLKSWSSFAIESGVADTARFLHCIARTEIPQEVLTGMSLARALRLSGTPVVMVNGWRLDPPPTSEELQQEIERDLRAPGSNGRAP